jgi:type VI secretion system secreted protein Hcp
MPFDCFLKIEGIDGESADAKHKGEIEVLSYHHGLSQSVTGTASSTGNISGQRVNIDSMTITKQLDKASPKLAGECAKGTVFKTATLTLNRAGGNKEPYMEYKLSNAIVSSVHVGGSSHGDGGVPTEEVGLSFTKIEWKYTVISEKGTAGGNVSAGWDLAGNKAV